MMIARHCKYEATRHCANLSGLWLRGA